MKSGFQILHALEQFSSLFSKDKLKGHTYTKPMIRLPCACRGRTAVRFPASRFHMCCEKLALDRLLCTHLSSKGFLRRMAVRMREVLARPWLVYVCPLLYICTNHNAVELSSIYFSSITVFHDTSKQIQQRARIGKIFARWHLAAIAITSLYGKTWPAHSIAKSLKSITFDQITGKVTDVSRTHIPLKALIIPLKRVKFWGVV